jgi:hypothetical protein
MLHDYGLTSSHFDTGELFNHAEERIAWAKELGLTQMATAQPRLRHAAQGRSANSG